MALRRHHRTPIDPTTADRMLDGLVVPDDAPPGFADVARALVALRTMAEVEPQARASVHAAALAATAASQNTGGTPMRHRRLATAIAATVVLICLLMLPVPSGLTPDAWRMVAIFLTTIVAIILKVMPLAVSLVMMPARVCPSLVLTV